MSELKITVIEDREDSGICQSCKREGLRWIAVLSDGSEVGLECAKKVLGFKPTPKSYNWVADYTLEATYIECGSTFGLWASKNGNQTRETKDGVLVSVGGVRNDWTQKGWI